MQNSRFILQETFKNEVKKEKPKERMISRVLERKTDKKLESYLIKKKKQEEAGAILKYIEKHIIITSKK